MPFRLSRQAPSGSCLPDLNQNLTLRRHLISWVRSFKVHPQHGPDFILKHFQIQMWVELNVPFPCSDVIFPLFFSWAYCPLDSWSNAVKESLEGEGGIMDGLFADSLLVLQKCSASCLDLYIRLRATLAGKWLILFQYYYLKKLVYLLCENCLKRKLLFSRLM